MKLVKPSFVYVPKVLTSVSFLLLLGATMWLFFGRNIPSIRLPFLTNFLPDFYQHISNLALSYNLLAVIGYFWLMLGVKFRHIAGVGLTILLLNILIEAWVTFLNTPDNLDMLYGVIGVVAGLLYLALVKRFGLVKYLPTIH